jgi:hypothetical protein
VFALCFGDFSSDYAGLTESQQDWQKMIGSQSWCLTDYFSVSTHLLSLADSWPTWKDVKCSPDNGSFLLFLQIVRPRRSWASSPGSQRTRTQEEPYPTWLFTPHQPEAGDWKESSSLSPLQSRTPLWAEDAGLLTPISRPKRDLVLEACSPNGMSLQGPFLGLKDVDIRTPGLENSICVRNIFPKLAGFRLWSSGLVECLGHPHSHVDEWTKVVSLTLSRRLYVHLVAEY